MQLLFFQFHYFSKLLTTKIEIILLYLSLLGNNLLSPSELCQHLQLNKYCLKSDSPSPIISSSHCIRFGLTDSCRVIDSKLECVFRHYRLLVLFSRDYGFLGTHQKVGKEYYCQHTYSWIHLRIKYIIRKSYISNLNSTC